MGAALLFAGMACGDTPTPPGPMDSEVQPIDLPETAVSETEVPETEVSETEVSETEVPDTDVVVEPETTDIPDIAPDPDVPPDPDVFDVTDAPPTNADVIIEHHFPNVELGPDGAPMFQTTIIDLPDSFVTVEAQIKIRGDLDNFPMAFMTFMVETDSQLKQCGNVSGLPQKPNNKLDDTYRIAWPQPVNIDKNSVFFPPSAPFDFQELPCADLFQGKKSITIGMLGIGIHTPGSGGNQGPNACGGAGCPNDAIVTLVFKQEATIIEDVGTFPDTVPDTVPDTEPPPPPPTGEGTCGQPTPFELSLSDPMISIGQPGSVLHKVPWPPIYSVCATSKPPNALEYFYQMNLTDYGFLTVSMQTDPQPWPVNQYFLDLQLNCDVGLQCGKSSQDLKGVASPGNYLVGITLAPPFEVYPPNETDWMFNLQAELTPLDWGFSEEIVSGSELQVAFNNTPMATRDGAGDLHAVWALGGIAQHGTKGSLSANWTIQNLPQLMGGSAVKPTLVNTNGSTLLAAYAEKSATNPPAAAVLQSLDSGVTWSAPLQLSATDVGVETLSLYGYSFPDGTPGGVVAWHDPGTGDAVVSTWQGGPWDASGWSTPVAVDSGPAASRDVSLGGLGELVLVVWEDDRAAYKQIFRAVSLAGGQVWGPDDAIGVYQTGSKASAGGDPSVAIAANGEAFIAYQHQNKTYLVRSVDQGETFKKQLTLGNGLFARVAVNDVSEGIVTWEHFAGNMLDDSQKTVGTAFSFDSFTDAFGPHFMKDSASATGRIMASSTVSDAWTDVFWIDVTGPERALVHRAMKLP